MSDNFEKAGGPDELRASRKAEQREQRRRHQKVAPVAARYGVWTGEGYLRAGEGLEKHLAEQSLIMPTAKGSSRREKRRKRKKK